MSVYIKGISMPKNCYDCPFSSNVDIGVGVAHGCNLLKDFAQFADERRDDCPLVSVPDHGRLIDADALMKICREMQSIEWNNKAAPYSWAYAYESFEGDIENAPTIIPADKEVGE